MKYIYKFIRDLLGKQRIWWYYNPLLSNKYHKFSSLKQHTLLISVSVDNELEHLSGQPWLKISNYAVFKVLARVSQGLTISCWYALNLTYKSLTCLHWQLARNIGSLPCESFHRTAHNMPLGFSKSKWAKAWEIKVQRGKKKKPNNYNHAMFVT